MRERGFSVIHLSCNPLQDIVYRSGKIVTQFWYESSDGYALMHFVVTLPRMESPYYEDI